MRDYASFPALLDALTDKSGGPDACWPFTGKRNAQGYGCVSGREPGLGYQIKRAHRVAYEAAHGTLRHGEFVCHRCDSPSCVNPKHLFLGDPKINTRDMFRKGRGKAWGGGGKRWLVATKAKKQIEAEAWQDAHAIDSHDLDGLAL